jgi:iron complex outermembrane receptor protein
MPLNEGEDMGVYYSNFPDLLSSVNSIEVSKGSSISNNGTAGYAGSLNFESVDLTSPQHTTFYVGGGSFNTFKTNVEYNSGKVGKWAINFRATHQQTDGYRDFAYNNSQSAFLKVGYYFNPKHTIDFLSFVGQSRNGQAWIGNTMEEIELNPRANGCTKDETDKFIQNINKIQYKGFIGDNALLTMSVYQNGLNGAYGFDLDNYMVKCVDPNCDITNIIYTYNLKHNMVGANTALKLFWDNASWTTGVNGSKFRRSHIGTYNIDDTEQWNNVGFKNDINFFTKAKFNINKLSILGNLQYRHATFDYDGDIDFNKLYWDFFNWSAEARYTFNMSNVAYASVTKTHREPTRTDMFGGNEYYDGTLYAQNPESVTDFELGFNHNSEKLSLNVNAFYMDFNNELILNGASGANGLPIRVNAANSYRSGIELSIDYKPFEWLRLVNNSSYSQNKVIDGEYTYNHVMSPNWIVNQDVLFTHKNFICGLNAKYVSKRYIDLTNQYSLDDDFTLNLNLSYVIKNTTIGCNINKIVSTNPYANAMLGANGALYFVEAPCNFFVDLTFKF